MECEGRVRRDWKAPLVIERRAIGIIATSIRASVDEV
jgi:hypothetical protein